MLASKIALLEDDEFEIVVTLVDSFVSRAQQSRSPLNHKSINGLSFSNWNLALVVD